MKNFSFKTELIIIPGKEASKNSKKKIIKILNNDFYFIKLNFNKLYQKINFINNPNIGSWQKKYFKHLPISIQKQYFIDKTLEYNILNINLNNKIIKINTFLFPTLEKYISSENSFFCDEKNIISIKEKLLMEEIKNKYGFIVNFYYSNPFNLDLDNRIIYNLSFNSYDSFFQFKLNFYKFKLFFQKVHNCLINKNSLNKNLKTIIKFSCSDNEEYFNIYFVYFKDKFTMNIKQTFLVSCTSCYLFSTTVEKKEFYQKEIICPCCGNDKLTYLYK